MRKNDLILALTAIPGNPFIVFPSLAEGEIMQPDCLLYDIGELQVTLTTNELDGTAYESIVLLPEWDEETVEEAVNV